MRGFRFIDCQLGSGLMSSILTTLELVAQVTNLEWSMVEDMRMQRAEPIREQVAQQIRRAIDELRFKPGQVIVERELCLWTGASRPSVREALRQLESEGLMLSVPGKGVQVASVSAIETQHIYEVREVLEGLAGRLFTLRADETRRREMRDVVSLIESTAREGSALALAVNRFYEVLLDGASNPEVQSLLVRLRRRVALLRSTALAAPGRASEVVQEMGRIGEAIASGNADAADRACREHVVKAQETALRYL